MYRGWSVNLTYPGLDFTFETTLPVPPLYDTRQGPVLELVFWVETAQRWIHAVSNHFPQQLPPGHVQVAIGDMQWFRYHAQQGGRDGMIWAILELEAQQRGLHASPTH